jgi:hypothetical protein
MDARGAMVTRALLHEFPVTIGRGYDNDVILADPYVDATHLRIDEDESGMYAEDAGSVNGMRVNDAKATVKRAPVANGTRLRVGRTLLRIIDPAAPLPAPVKVADISAMEAWAHRKPLTAWAARGAAVALCLCFVAIDKWLSIHTRVFVAEVATSMLETLFMLTFWAAAWAAANRLARGRALFTWHLAVASAAITAIFAQGVAEDWSHFLWPRPSREFINTAVSAAIVAAGLYAHLSLATALRPRKRLLFAVGIPAAWLGYMLLDSVGDSDRFTTIMRIDGSLKPIHAQNVPTEPLEMLMSDMKEMHAKVDAAVKDAAKKSK